MTCDSDTKQGLCVFDSALNHVPVSLDGNVVWQGNVKMNYDEKCDQLLIYDYHGLSAETEQRLFITKLK